MEIELVKNTDVVNIDKGFDDNTLKKYSLELTHINNFIRNSKPEQQKKIMNALNTYPEYSHQKIAELSSIGLSVANGDYYIIPYGNNPKFDIDYKGLLKVSSIEARKNGYQLIAKADTIRDGFTKADVSTNGLIDNIIVENGKINGKILTAYAILALIDSDTRNVIMQKVEVLPINEFENAIKSSKGGTIHKDYGTEMGKKIALRRSVKILNTMFASDKLDTLFNIDNDSHTMVKENKKEDNQPATNIDSLILQGGKDEQ